MGFLKLLLYPFAALYNAIMRVRNHLYDIGHKPSFEFDTTVISVGNLNVGGSGKTPMVEYLISLLSEKYPTVTLSRGYKRETTGFRIAQPADTFRSIGDEPLQMLKKFGDRIHVAVGEDRVYAIPHILQEFPETKVVLLDDAMQQRSIRPNLTILLTTRARPFYRDFLLPFGRLRESRKGASRADVVVVTKCGHEMDESQEQEMVNRIRKHAGQKMPVFFSRVGYGDPKPIGKAKEFTQRVVLVTGIANIDAIVSYCEKHFEVVHHFRFADHHRYTRHDLESIDRVCAAQTDPFSVVATEKDAARLDCPEFATYLDRWNWFSLPIRHVFLKDGPKFDELVLQSVDHASKG